MFSWGATLSSSFLRLRIMWPDHQSTISLEDTGGGQGPRAITANGDIKKLVCGIKTNTCPVNPKLGEAGLKLLTSLLLSYGSQECSHYAGRQVMGSPQWLPWGLWHSQTFPLRWKCYFSCTKQLKCFSLLEMKVRMCHTTHFPQHCKSLPGFEGTGSGQAGWSPPSCCRGPRHESSLVNSTSALSNFGLHSEHSHSPMGIAIIWTLQGLTRHDEAENGKKGYCYPYIFFFNAGNCK